MNRPKLDPKDVRPILEGIKNRIDYEVEPARKGTYAFASTHEVLGALEEEHHELIDAIKSNDTDHVCDELFDIAVVCVWGILSLQKQETDNELPTD
jgi:hypothetical protein